MQYLLTQEEYDALKAKQSAELKLSTKKLQALCTKIADEMPITFWGNTEAEPWGCIHSVDNDEWYCDYCPVQEICPEKSKEWSK